MCFDKKTNEMLRYIQSNPGVTPNEMFDKFGEEYESVCSYLLKNDYIEQPPISGSSRKWNRYRTTPKGAGYLEQLAVEKFANRGSWLRWCVEMFVAIAVGLLANVITR